MRRLSPGVLIIGTFAILFGLLASYGVKAYIAHPVPAATPARPPEQPQMVPLASLDLPAGRTLVEDDVMLVPMTREQIAKAELPAIWMSSVAQIAGRTLREPLERGKPFEPTAFYPVGIGPSVADQLRAGERAVTISFKSEAVDAAFVTPGASVDVLFRSAPDKELDVPDATVTLLSGVRVLAVGENTIEGTIAKAPESGQGQTVTLAVSQTQARALKVVEGRGTLTLALRHGQDVEQAETAGPTTLPGLLGLKEPMQPFVSEIYRHTSLATMVFQDGKRQQTTLEPPYGLPVSREPAESAAQSLDVWLPRFGEPYWNRGYSGFQGGGGYGYRRGGGNR